VCQQRRRRLSARCPGPMAEGRPAQGQLGI
jgi:hypothetical protein